jgi:predicted TIM-barrel fold metal-dependent hydrolase
MLLEEYTPRPALVTKVTEIRKPRFPVIDSHNHLGMEWSGWLDRPVSELLEVLDESGVRGYVDLDGGWGEEILHSHLDHFKAAAPDRFVMFGGVAWGEWVERGNAFPEWAAQRMREQARRGAKGLKIWKAFGLQFQDPSGRRVAVDDHRLDTIWETCAELNWPVLIHVADPVAFFDPLDQNNERWEELSKHPDWHFPSPKYPPFMQIMDEFEGLIKRHPRTTFVGAHVGCYAENLAWVGALMDQCPNFNVDISARLGELGRQPYAARRFFLNHADRIVFGLDGTPEAKHYQAYYRFLETDDEYFDYSPWNPPPQGRWMIYGISLPEDVLAKVYYQNAERLTFRV